MTTPQTEKENQLHLNTIFKLQAHFIKYIETTVLIH